MSLFDNEISLGDVKFFRDDQELKVIQFKNNRVVREFEYHELDELREWLDTFV